MGDYSHFFTIFYRSPSSPVGIGKSRRMAVCSHLLTSPVPRFLRRTMPWLPKVDDLLCGWREKRDDRGLFPPHFGTGILSSNLPQNSTISQSTYRYHRDRGIHVCLQESLEWSYWVWWDIFIALYNGIALKMRISLLHSNRVRFECNKLHFIALKAHFTFIVGIVSIRRFVVF